MSKKFENKLPTRRAIYAKVKDQKDKVTASGQAQSTWGIQLSKDLRLEASADQRLGTGAFKVVRENNGYCVQCTLPITFTIFPKFLKKSVEPCPWQVTTQFIKLEPVPIYLELSFILFA
ncbi:hypothetical protein MTR_7g105150 [Medicago truncatula]|uniref:Uncharacterized protein n=1 Tax=Medicago truncatula TaxID=3880 RepID=A0A072U362_MEDTR|nr:hypothetical protein MTR_7g105150 [Medicago truncatula]